MGKGGTVLGLIGILIGAGGLIFGYISWNSMNSIQTDLDNLSITEAWYNETFSTFVITPAFTLLEIPDLIVSFTLESNASIYLSFTCRARTFSSTGHSRAYFYFKIDGEHIYEPLTYVGNYNGGSESDYFSVNLQYFIENMDAGNHNVTIEVSTTNPAHEPHLNSMSLFVQSFAP